VLRIVWNVKKSEKIGVQKSTLGGGVQNVLYGIVPIFHVFFHVSDNSKHFFFTLKKLWFFQKKIFFLIFLESSETRKKNMYSVY
jgi:hypothetical protein